MKLLLLSDANSIHTWKWVHSLKLKGVEIKLFSFFKPKDKMHHLYIDNNVKVITPGIEIKSSNLREPNFRKLKYLRCVFFLRKIIRDFSPDLIHAHYISSYGLLGYLSGFHPLILSAWGSDVYYFPEKSKLNNQMIKFLLARADVVCSSSNVMANHIQKKFNRNDVVVVPFGVDINYFKSDQKEPSNFTVGTIKSIEDHNGIECIIDAAKIIKQNYDKEIDFVIVGKGTLMNRMIKRVDDYDLKSNIKFLGFINHDQIVDHYNKLSIFVAVSLRESFGVSILEAASCSVPSITSNIGGLIEVNLHTKTGRVIEPNNPEQLANEIIYFYENEEIRKKMGNIARRRVEKHFNWNDNVSQMLDIYKSTLKINEK